MSSVSSIEALGMKKVFTTKVLVNPRKMPAMINASRMGTPEAISVADYLWTKAASEWPELDTGPGDGGDAGDDGDAGEGET